MAGAFGAARPLGGPAAPVAASSAYLGDVAIASPVRTRAGWAIAVRVQRHYSESPARARLVPVGASPVEALAATMDYRAEVLLVWASGGAVYARELSPAGALGPVQRLGSLAAGSPDPNCGRWSATTATRSWRGAASRWRPAARPPRRSN